MKLFLIFLGCILAFLVLVYFRCACKRLSLCWKLKKLCREKGMTLCPAHRFWLFGTKWDTRVDFYLESKRRVYAVKLFGIPLRHTELVFRENGAFFIRYFVGMIAQTGAGVRFPIETRTHPFPVYRFRYRYREEWETKDPVQVLLVHPTCIEFRRQTGRMETIVGPGTYINNCMIFSLSRFLGYLEVME